MGLLPIVMVLFSGLALRFCPFPKGPNDSTSCVSERKVNRWCHHLLWTYTCSDNGCDNERRNLITPIPLCSHCLEVKEASHRHLPQFQELEALRHYHHPSPSPPPLSLHRCQEGEEVEAVSLEGEVEVGGSWKVEVGCQAEEVEMGTRRMVHWAEEVLLGQQRKEWNVLFIFKYIFVRGDSEDRTLSQCAPKAATKY